MNRTMFVAVLFTLGGALAVGQAQDSSESEATLERAMLASPDEMSANAPRWVEEIDQWLAGIVKLDATTRRTTAETGLPCVVNNVASVQRLSGSSKTALKSMEAALARNEIPSASFDYQKIAVALKAARELYVAAEECALGAGVRQGKTRSEVTGSPSNPIDDTKGIPNDIVEYGFDPPDASPF